MSCFSFSAHTKRILSLLVGCGAGPGELFALPSKPFEDSTESLRQSVRGRLGAQSQHDCRTTGTATMSSPQVEKIELPTPHAASAAQPRPPGLRDRVGHAIGCVLGIFLRPFVPSYRDREER